MLSRCLPEMPVRCVSCGRPMLSWWMWWAVNRFGWAGSSARSAEASGVSLTIVPVTFRQACAFIAAFHRHHRPPRGMKFALGVADSNQLVGVATVGRPVARQLDDGTTVEVTRTCTLGTRNANSMLYAAAWRTARAMGYRRMITYTQLGETGASLRAAGLQPMKRLRARSGWDTPSRPRVAHGTERICRVRWEIQCAQLGGEVRVRAYCHGRDMRTTRSSDPDAGSPCVTAVSDGTAGYVDL